VRHLHELPTDDTRRARGLSSGRLRVGTGHPVGRPFPAGVELRQGMAARRATDTTEETPGGLGHFSGADARPPTR
jgi:hypothetical protein